MMRAIHHIVLVLLLWFVGLCAAAQFAKIAVPFTFVRAQYPDAGTELGWMLTLISAVGAVFGMTAGTLVAKVGFAKSVIFALVLGGSVSLWQATIPDFNIMLLSRVIEGISHLMIVVATPTLIAQIASDRFRGICMTLWSTFFGVSFALTAWIGLPLVAASGLSALLMWHGILMLVLAAILGVTFWYSKLPTDQYASSRLRVSIWQLHFDAYSSARVVSPAIGWLFYTMTFVSLLTVLPELLPASIRTTIVGLMPVVSIVVSLVVVSALLVRYSAITIVVLGFILSTAVILAFFAGLPLPYVCIGLFAMLGLVQGATFSAVPELNPTSESRALANGAVAQMGNIGNLVGTPILLGILGLAGSTGVLLSVAALYVLGSLAHVFFTRLRTTQGSL